MKSPDHEELDRHTLDDVPSLLKPLLQEKRQTELVSLPLHTTLPF